MLDTIDTHELEMEINAQCAKAETENDRKRMYYLGENAAVYATKYLALNEAIIMELSPEVAKKIKEKAEELAENHLDRGVKQKDIDTLKKYGLEDQIGLITLSKEDQNLIDDLWTNALPVLLIDEGKITAAKDLQDVYDHLDSGKPVGTMPFAFDEMLDQCLEVGPDLD